MLQDVYRDYAPAHVAQKIIQSLARPCIIGDQEYRVTASIGISMFPGDSTDPDVLIRNADTAMYHAKAQGRNRFSYFSGNMNEAVATTLDVENGLRRAIDHNNLLLHYQPQLHVGHGQIVGAEALVRWRNPERGLISPDEFIPIAEESGLIYPIGAWVLRSACEDAVRWHGRGRLRVGVNVSTRQLVDKNFADLVATTLRETGLDPRRLELEVTESSVLQERGVTLATVRLVRQLGVRVSIDDFGTGYSALSALRQMPIDGLKIDRSFVIDLISDPAVGTITAGLISIANGLGLEATAEGVENREQMEFLHSQGCDQMQGNLFAKPMPADEFAAELRSERPIWMQELDRARDR